MKEYSKSIESVIDSLNSSYNGLDEIKIKNSIRLYGKNQMTKPKGKSLFKRIIDALLEPMLIILEVAVMVTLGVNIGKALKGVGGDFYECLGILLAIAISVILTVVMEGRSQKAFEMLGKMYETLSVKVRRKGVLTIIPQTEVVVGDIVLFESGDKIVADGRLIKSTNLELDESMLTGESFPIKKQSHIELNENTPLAERVNMVYSGTFVTSGSGEMIVTAVGDNAEIGVIASDLQISNAVSAPLQEKLDRLGKLIAWLGIIASVFVLILSVTRLFVTNNVTFDSLEEVFLSSIILIVASVPEGLPTTVAIALTLNVVKLYKSNALIKKLVAAETVGCVSVICSDKTGTLTENKMKVLKVYYNDTYFENKAFNNLNLAVNFAVNTTASVDVLSKDKKFIGKPTEVSLLEFLIDNKKFDYFNLIKKFSVVKQTPFSSESKFMSTTVVNGLNEVEYIKGAPEVVLDKCNLSLDKKQEILNRISIEQDLARRVLAFSHGENGKMIFDGFAVISDSVRKDVYNSVEECKRAGIAVKMLTGDNYNTAFSIASELKIASNKNEVVNASDIENISDEKLKLMLPNVKVVARSTPKTKLRIVRLLKDLGEVVAVTGDGINDAPAIKHADIGIAMGGGSEITKEVSDIILLDDSFSTIIKAITFGRNIYQNFQRFIMFQLSVNLTAVLFIIFSLVLGLENPFTTLQLLWINVIMDGPPALTLGLESRGNELMNNKPVKRSNNLVGKKMLIRILTHSLFMCLVLVLQYKYNFIGCTSEELSTVMFSLFIIFQLFNAFNCRELGSKSVVRNLKSNKSMLIVFSITFILQIIICEFGGKLFNTTPLSLIVWVKTIFVALGVVVISEIYKCFYRFAIKKQKNSTKLIKSFN